MARALIFMVICLGVSTAQGSASLLNQHQFSMPMPTRNFDPCLLAISSFASNSERISILKVLLEKASFSKKGECVGCADHIYQKIHPRFAEARRIHVDTQFSIETADGNHSAGMQHDFNVLPAFGNQLSLIVDTTYLQFLNLEAREKLWPIFIGTEADLKNIFREHRLSIRIALNPPSSAPIHDTDKFVEMIYGFGQGAKFRQVIGYSDGTQYTPQ